MDNEVTVQDLISLSYEQKPIDFEQAFGSLVTDRIAQAIENRKAEIAQSVFGGQPVEDETETADETEQEDLNVDDDEFENETDLDSPEETEDGETA